MSSPNRVKKPMINLSLSNRIILALTICLLMVILSSMAGIGYTIVLDKQVSPLTANEMLLKVNSLQLSWSILNESAMGTSPMSIADQISQIDNNYEAFSQVLDPLRGLPFGFSQKGKLTNKAMLDELSVLVNEFHNQYLDLIKKNEKTGSIQASPSQTESILNAQNNVTSQLNDLRASVQKDIKAYTSRTIQYQRMLRLFWVIIILLAFGIIFAFGFSNAKRLTRRVNQLFSNMLQLQEDSFPTVEPLKGADEIETLSNVFSALVRRVKESADELEQQKLEHKGELRQKNLLVQVTSDIARDIASSHDMDELLNHAMDMIHERFGFYHSGLFLIDDRQEYAVLVAATGGPGKEMLARKYRLLVGGTGMVGYVAEKGEPRFAMDVDSDSVHFKNPLLSDTRSELALPLLLRGQVVGVLDVQSNRANSFEEDTVAILRTMADQLSTAIENARLLESANRTLQELRNLYSSYSEQAWSDIQRSAGVVGYEYDRVNARPIFDERQKNDLSSLPTENQYVIPIDVRGIQIGVLEVSTEMDKITNDDLRLLTDLSQRLGQILESARLFQETRRQALREQKAGQATARIRDNLDMETVLKTALDEIYNTMGLESLMIQLAPDYLDSPINT